MQSASAPACQSNNTVCSTRHKARIYSQHNASKLCNYTRLTDSCGPSLRLLAAIYRAPARAPETSPHVSAIIIIMVTTVFGDDKDSRDHDMRREAAEPNCEPNSELFFCQKVECIWGLNVY